MRPVARRSIPVFNAMRPHISRVQTYPTLQNPVHGYLLRPTRHINHVSSSIPPLTHSHTYEYTPNSKHLFRSRITEREYEVQQRLERTEPDGAR
ncbi:hypothetical protein KQX54_007284 [Cotesia glomerata]|uniref:Uncharacterized protein n=1 Tax=Cotesia glomerata TaxID=32391 RepID=A0AAV7I7Q4_COTGL|nr:hypothetical protein KQX54_007284 [Cotesia glomerata]